MRRLSKSEIRYWMASFSFFTLLKKSEATLALLDTFQELHLEWYAWVIIVFDVCFFIYNLMKSSVVYAAISFMIAIFWVYIWGCKVDVRFGSLLGSLQIIFF